MKTKALITTVVITLVIITGELQAALVFQPADLNAGDEYRLVFTSSTVRDATSADIADYNAHVQAAADAAPVVSTWGLSWTAIASTPTVDAISNTATPVSTPDIPVFLIDGTKVADNYADLWDGSLASPLSRTELDTVPAVDTWTGTDTDGTASIVFPLGAANVRFGSSNATTGLWVSTASTSRTQMRPLYAISNTVTAVPEPSAFLHLGLFGLGIGVWRKTARKCCSS